jgi:hypothetical protein
MYYNTQQAKSKGKHRQNMDNNEITTVEAQPAQFTTLTTKQGRIAPLWRRFPVGHGRPRPRTQAALGRAVVECGHGEPGDLGARALRVRVVVHACIRTKLGVVVRRSGRARRELGDVDRVRVERVPACVGRPGELRHAEEGGVRTFARA